MKNNLKYITNENYLNIELEENIDNSNMKEMFFEILNLSKKMNIKNLIIDCRNINFNLNFSGILKIADIAVGKRIEIGKHALFINLNQLKYGKFLENYMVNRGIGFKYVTRKHEALEWFNKS